MITPSKIIARCYQRIFLAYAENFCHAPKVKGCYHFIPSNDFDFIIVLHKAIRKWRLFNKKSHHKLKFVDAGCGPGLKCALASAEFNLKATGIEHNKKLVELAKQLGINDIIHGDIFDQDYSIYDIIYMYRPLQDDRLWYDFQEKILRESKVGSIIISAEFDLEASMVLKVLESKGSMYSYLKIRKYDPSMYKYAGCYI